MNRETYKQIKSEIHKKYSLVLKKLDEKYAFANSSVVFGDVVSDQNNTIKVDKIGWCYAFMATSPSCVYSGPKLRRDRKPYKSGEWETVYQSNMLEADNE